ncbi:hypothetical protein [Mycobacterium lepromatosis]|uniref:hypothetical protein n=1 Tax=Mycobacterium lepromatosis TaxID=480418 RepID=UPI000A503D7F|nr:hypothetical protein [Mycobacterium lepromatosis]
MSVAVGVFSGGPDVGFEEAVLEAAAKGQVVDVGGAVGGVSSGMANFAVVVVGYGASRCGAVAVFGVQ